MCCKARKLNCYLAWTTPAFSDSLWPSSPLTWIKATILSNPFRHIENKSSAFMLLHCKVLTWPLSRSFNKQHWRMFFRSMKTFFSKSQMDFGFMASEQHRSTLTNNFPIHRPPYRWSQADKAEIARQADCLIQQGVVRPSFSPDAAPVILAEKKGEGGTHLCIGYRKLNVVTLPDYQPIPSIDVLHNLGTSR